MIPAVQIMTTCASQEEGLRIATVLVERRLAACVQVEGPISSCYRWQGKIETANEWRCVIKTRASLYNQVERAVRELHSYSEPEILAIELVAGSEGYLQWLAAETSEDQ